MTILFEAWNQDYICSLIKFGQRARVRHPLKYEKHSRIKAVKISNDYEIHPSLLLCETIVHSFLFNCENIL